MINDNSNIHNKKSVQIPSFIWPVSHLTRSEYGNSQRKSLYSVRIQEKRIRKKLHVETFFTQWLSHGALILLILQFKLVLFVTFTLREKCPYSELFWSVLSHIWTEYGEILRVSPYSVRMRENTDQNNSECVHFLCMAIIRNITYSESWLSPQKVTA